MPGSQRELLRRNQRVASFSIEDEGDGDRGADQQAPGIGPEDRRRKAKRRCPSAATPAPTVGAGTMAPEAVRR